MDVDALAIVAAQITGAGSTELEVGSFGSRAESVGDENRTGVFDAKTFAIDLEGIVSVVDLVSELFAEGVEHVVQHAGNLFSFVFSGTEPLNFADVKAQQGYRYAPFFHSMLESGVSLPPSVFEAWFLTTAHDDVALERVLDALPGAARAAAGAPDPTLLAQ